MTLACLNISSKKKCLKRLFTYHLKAHKISNKLVIKVSAQKKGEKVMTATNMCSNLVGKWDSPPLKAPTPNARSNKDQKRVVLSIKKSWKVFKITKNKKVITSLI